MIVGSRGSGFPAVLTPLGCRGIFSRASVPALARVLEKLDPIADGDSIVLGDCTDGVVSPLAVCDEGATYSTCTVLRLDSRGGFCVSSDGSLSSLP